ncbi:MAG: FKBP-type peptidyl-prolyl cis-trans isomerase [Prevotellaceae bacterium]|nr:FKBP-type peptidyl-prolyl cis-trans isomerase [Prevotellaceae bacterium]
MDSVSYSIGVDFGTGLASGIKNIPGEKLNIDIIVAAFANALKGNEPLIPHEFATEYFQNYYQAQVKEKFQKEGAEFLAKNKQEKGVVTLPSGLQYLVLTEGTGAKPAADQQVTVNYEGFLVDGTKFDSSIDRGEPATFGVTQVIKGWTEALQLMPVGSKWKLFIPYDLAYGEQGAGQFIPPYATLVFEVELLEIK